MKIADVQIDLAIQTAWMACFNLFGNLFKIIAMYAFVIYTAVSVSFKTSLKPQCTTCNPDLMALIIIPFGMILMDAAWLSYSIYPASEKNLKAMEADDIWSSFMVQASFLRQVITTYRKGFKISETFEKIHKNYNNQAFEASLFSKNTQYMANFFPTISAALIMIFAGQQAIKQAMSVSTFVVFTNTVNSFGGVLAGVFMDLFQIGKGYASIKKLSALLNADTRRKQLLRGTERRKDEITSYIKEKKGPFDPDGIIIYDLAYSYSSDGGNNLGGSTSCYADGGQIIVLKGGGAVGKKTFLRLLARHFVPTQGFIYYPPRWRMRFMSAVPLFFGGDLKAYNSALALALEENDHTKFDKEKRNNLGTLEYNLKFGAQFSPDPEAIDVWDTEIFNLCKRLGVSKARLGETEKEFREVKKYAPLGLNGEKLSITDQVLLSVARALLSSVDFLLISNMLDLLSPEQADNVLKILAEWCEKRCISELKMENSMTPAGLRKKKTVIFSTKHSESLANSKFVHNHIDMGVSLEM
jgi:ABC-type transport system involved in cytochrome bd biosynthesis fused ATPase/permease subunit